MDIPHGPADLSPGWLTNALRETGTIHSAYVSSFQESKIDEDRGLIGQLARLRLSYNADEQDAPRTLIAKFAPADPQNRARQCVLGVVPEVLFYTQLSDHVALRTPHCYYGAFDETGAFVLLLEDLSPARNGDTLSGCCAEEAELALRHLARFHARWWETSQLGAMRWLIGADPAIFAQVVAGYRSALSRSWPFFCQSVGETLPEETVSGGLASCRAKAPINGSN